MSGTRTLLTLGYSVKREQTCATPPEGAHVAFADEGMTRYYACDREWAAWCKKLRARAEVTHPTAERAPGTSRTILTALERTAGGFFYQVTVTLLEHTSVVPPRDDATDRYLIAPPAAYRILAVTPDWINTLIEHGSARVLGRVVAWPRAEALASIKAGSMTLVVGRPAWVGGLTQPVARTEPEGKDKKRRKVTP